ncbi:carbamoyl-phosphate synthase (glutamine-hydrolyzing) large subunit [Candidatus Woesearchaeota archaeon]|nr:carbamoyl-phosphate synthase (glutamine-hydrolyzing) large subunit [Candidatus Woesearchaeota archaeon]
MKVNKVIILGSGALKIGEAGEFDYSGSQAIKALKEERIKTVLVNPNIATVQTSKGLADKVYFLPVTPYFVEKIIKKEKPDGILLSFGGQTALNCGVELYKKGVLKKNNVKVLGTPVESIIATEDREIFVKKLDEVGLLTPKSKAVKAVSDALKTAKKIGYPVMIRSAYALGGLGSGVVKDEKHMKDAVSKALSASPQILVEEYLGGWKEVEYEVVRDRADNCITVCNMENFDPLGIHTGESIVVAPSQTLNNHEYHKLRKISINAIRHLGIVGECNIQYALDPDSDEYRIIEVNARLSRSSALASKATGYPLAFVAAKLALGKLLTQIKNSITKKTMACFEPALDYVVVKIPRWDLKKFKGVSKRIGSGMKSVGEVMSIGRKFEEALQKAIRMLGIGAIGLVANGNYSFKNLDEELKRPTDERVFAVARAIEKGYSVDKIFDMTKIDKWFLYKIKNIVELKKEINGKNLGYIKKELMIDLKQKGFSDEQISVLANSTEENVRKKRNIYKIHPVVKQIDTLAAEYPAKTNYLYLTFNGNEDDVKFDNRKSVAVLGGGPYRIGSSVEFDWCCVSSVLTAKKVGYKTIMINFNPETVSTDYDICDRLYFDELSFESVYEINRKEKPNGFIISMGGQIPNNLALPMEKEGINVLGTSPKSIDNAEDRYKFSKLLDELEIDQPEWKELKSLTEAKSFAKKVGYPVLIRPSYVLSGSAMNVASDEEDLVNYLKQASDVSKKHPVVITKFLLGAKEIEIDAVAKNGELLAYAISEHIENAGVHSGDATLVFPPQKTYLETIRRIKTITKQLTRKLKITGPFNIQFLAKNNEIKIIELNLRASRSFPFVSKILKLDMIELATKAILNEKVHKAKKSIFEIDYVGVKMSQFSFTRLAGADPITGVEMASTGEVGCFGDDVEEAYLKSLISTGVKLPEKNILVSISGDENRYEIIDSIKKLKEQGFDIFATQNTHNFYNMYGIKTKKLHKIHEKKEPNILTYMKKGKIELVISIPRLNLKDEAKSDTYLIRRLAADYSIHIVNNIQLIKILTDSLTNKNMEDLEILNWDDY